MKESGKRPEIFQKLRRRINARIDGRNIDIGARLVLIHFMPVCSTKVRQSKQARR